MEIPQFILFEGFVLFTGFLLYVKVIIPWEQRMKIRAIKREVGYKD